MIYAFIFEPVISELDLFDQGFYFQRPFRGTNLWIGTWLGGSLVIGANSAVEWFDTVYRGMAIEADEYDASGTNIGRIRSGFHLLKFHINKSFGKEKVFEIHPGISVGYAWLTASSFSSGYPAIGADLLIGFNFKIKAVPVKILLGGRNIDFYLSQSQSPQFPGSVDLAVWSKIKRFSLTGSLCLNYIEQKVIFKGGAGVSYYLKFARGSSFKFSLHFPFGEARLLSFGLKYVHSLKNVKFNIGYTFHYSYWFGVLHTLQIGIEG